MSPYVLLILDRDLRLPPGADLAAALEALGFRPQAPGAKGPVDLAAGCWMADLPANELPFEELRRQVADRVSTALERLEARGGFLLHLCLRGGWAYRPVPRGTKSLAATGATRA
jgi:hypothetical protein